MRESGVDQGHGAQHVRLVGFLPRCGAVGYGDGGDVGDDDVDMLLDSEDRGDPSLDLGGDRDVDSVSVGTRCWEAGCWFLGVALHISRAPVDDSSFFEAGARSVFQPYIGIAAFRYWVDAQALTDGSSNAF